MTVMVFYDTPSAKCDVYSVPKGKLKILQRLWKQDRCKNESNRGSEGERERAKDKNGRYASAGNTDETTQTGACI